MRGQNLSPRGGLRQLDIRLENSVSTRDNSTTEDNSTVGVNAGSALRGAGSDSENHSTQGTASEAGHDAGGSRARPPAPRPPPAPPHPLPARLNPLKRAARAALPWSHPLPAALAALGKLSGPGAVGTRGRMGSPQPQPVLICGNWQLFQSVHDIST